MRPNLAELLAGTDWLDEQWYFDPRGEESQVRTLSLLSRLRRERFDMALLMPNSLRVAVIAWLGKAKERIGHVRYGRGSFLTGKIFPPRANGQLTPQPMVDYYLAVAETAGCPPESPRLELACTVAETQLADKIWERLGLRGDGRVIALNSSGAYGAAKLWPVEHFGELARLIADRTEHDVLVVCGPRERDIARDIVSRADRRRVFSLADQPLGLSTSKACIHKSRLMVSTDSGPRHIAAAFGKPVITLFGSTMPIWIENPTVRAVNLQLDVDCIGCAKRACPLGHHKCMRDLSPEVVYSEVVKLLEEDARVRVA